jgi:hypothetical protein
MPPPTQVNAANLRTDQELRVVSFAGFNRDVLDVCEDVSMRGTLIPDADAREVLASIQHHGEEMWKGVQSKQKGSRSVVKLGRPCGEQFADRKPFAVCSDEVIAQAMAAFRGTTVYYSFANVFRSDFAMRKCLEHNGSWRTMSRDSDEFREAQLRFEAAGVPGEPKELPRH